MWAKCLVPVCGWNSWQPLRLSRGERDIASPANTAIAPNTDIGPVFHVFASSLGCSNRTVSSESCISAWSSHKSDQHPSTTAQHRSILPLWSPLRKVSIKSESKSDLKTAYDSSTSLGLLPCCPGACPLLSSPATGTLHRSRGQHCYSDKTELRESLLRAVLGTHILSSLCKFLC